MITAAPDKQSKSIPLAPFGKARPRVTRNGTFMPDTYVKAKHDLAMLFGPVEVEGNVQITIAAVMPMPRSWSKVKQREMMGEFCNSKPDIDNVAGAVMDALFPQDDKRVVSLICLKVWGQAAGMDITIEGVVTR